MMVKCYSENRRVNKSDVTRDVCLRPTSFPESLFSASLGRWKKDSGCGWSRYHPESEWQKNLLAGRGGRVFCLVDVTDFVGFKSVSVKRRLQTADRG